MKATIKVPKEIEITHIAIAVPVRFNEEDIPNNFPMRNGDVWGAVVNIDTGHIEGWPQGRSGSMHMKVCDEGVYKLLGKDGIPLAVRQGDYVPHGVVPGEYGDYVILDINEQGVITNWPKQPDVSEFFDLVEE